MMYFVQKHRLGQVRNVMMVVAITAAMAVALAVFTFLYDSIPEIVRNGSNFLVWLISQATGMTVN